ncbi:DUF4169 family protein [Psychromarinibacter halotolerans]|uniref:DUF4169 family protein n=1 Tax=Psychromarinibacter halotolerans TaxID=1775175 RepID=A0ABV7GXR6_9RHOB|nr:DUF4169 family protein [Psychromarinibacter halotolerans]MDF0597522.1 DUF4169 family protein [Psychromarinibacter halotolerans]
MSNVTNLRQARKDRARADKRAAANENAAKHGRSKAQRVLDATQNAKAKKKLDDHRFEEE